jgi:hypothetical protein
MGAAQQMPDLLGQAIGGSSAAGGATATIFFGLAGIPASPSGY